MLNLVVNARDAIGEGGHIGVSTALHDLPAKGERPAGRYICIAVTDDGAGINPATVRAKNIPMPSNGPRNAGSTRSGGRASPGSPRNRLRRLGISY